MEARSSEIQPPGGAVALPTGEDQAAAVGTLF